MKQRNISTQFARAARMSLLAFPLLLAAGCSDKSANTGSDKPLRILYGNEESFQYNYGDYFALKFPDVKVEIVPTTDLYKPGVDTNKETVKLIREQKPDLIITHTFYYGDLVANGLLLDLEPLARKTKFDLSAFAPAAIAQLKENDEGKLFGLAPQLTSSALYYNKDLFDKYGVPYPVNKMSWDETMRLARRFPVDPDPEKRIYGIHEKYSSPFDFIYDIANTEGASYVSPDSRKVTVDSDVWKKAFRHVVDGFKNSNLFYYYKDGKTISYGPNETKDMDLFSTGKAAMMISGTEQMFRMKQWGEKGLNWDIVTVPVDPANPDYTRYFTVSPIYAISAGAEQAELAWKIVEYLNSEEAAKVALKTSDVLSTRSAFSKTKEGLSLEPFYMLKRKPVDFNRLTPLPANFYNPFVSLIIQEVHEAVQGRVTVDDAVRRIQEEAQAMLDKAWVAEDAKPK